MEQHGVRGFHRLHEQGNGSPCDLRGNRAEAKDLLGFKGRTNLESIFKYNSTKQGQRTFGDTVTKVAKWVSERVPAAALAGVGYHLGGFEGAAELGAAGESAYGATKLVLHKIATDPEVGRNLLYALDSGARPENFTPHIGAQILRSLRQAGRAVHAGPLAASQTAQTLGGN